MKEHYGFMSFTTAGEVELLVIDRLEKEIMKELAGKEFPVFLRNDTEPIYIHIEKVKFTIINQDK